MTEPKVSERMRNLVANVGHTACLYGQSQHDDGLLELSNQADAALLTAIAELEQRAEKAGASAETIEVLADVIRKHHADIVIADAEGEPKADDDTWVVCAINELGRQRERADTAEAERDLLMQEPDNRLDGYRELGAKCAALEEQKDALKVERDKWKRVAVAYQRWENAERIFRAHEFPPPEILRALQNAQAKLTSTIADLGPLWDEAVNPQKGEG